MVDCHLLESIDWGKIKILGNSLRRHPVKNVILIKCIIDCTGTRMRFCWGVSSENNKFHRRETLPCDIQNCHPANWPIRLLEINMRYNKVLDYHPSKSIVNLGSTSVDNVSSGDNLQCHPIKNVIFI